MGEVNFRTYHTVYWELWSETFAGNVTTSISICAISKNSCSMLRSSQNANRCSSMSKIRFCQKKCLQLENKSYLTKCCTTVRHGPFEIVNLNLVHPKDDRNAKEKILVKDRDSFSFYSSLFSKIWLLHFLRANAWVAASDNKSRQPSLFFLSNNITSIE